MADLEEAIMFENFYKIHQLVGRKEEGADVNMRFQPAGYDDRKEFTPLHFAVEYAGIEMIELLINHGAATNSQDFLGRTPLHIACKYPGFHSESIQYPNSGYNYSNLSTEEMKSFLPAICEVHLDVVKLLLKHTRDINSKDNTGNTPLFYILQHNYVEDNIDRLMYPVRQVKNSLLIIKEFKYSKKNIVEHLVKHGADVKVRNNKGETALHLAIMQLKFSRKPKNYQFLYFNDSTDTEMIKSILKMGADIEAKTEKGVSPLQIAIALLSSAVVDLLLDFGADIKNLKLHSTNDKFFVYPDTLLPNLDAVENVCDIMESLSMKDFHLRIEDNLTVLKFLICNNAHIDVPESLSNCDIKCSCRILNLLHYGNGHDLEKFINKITFEYSVDLCGQSDKDLLIYIILHFYKIKYGDLYFDKKMKDIILSILPRDGIYSRVLPPKHFFDREIEKLKITSIDKNKSLNEVLVSHPWKRHYCIMNGTYKKIVKTENFNEEFVHYSGLIEGHIAKYLIRQYVLKTAIFFSKFSNSVGLPELCSRKIFNYLNNDDLFNLYLADSELVL